MWSRRRGCSGARAFVDPATREALLDYPRHRPLAPTVQGEHESQQLVFANEPGQSRFASVMRRSVHTSGANPEAPEITVVV
jgi:hypothetical protein